MLYELASRNLSFKRIWSIHTANGQQPVTVPIIFFYQINSSFSEIFKIQTHHFYGPIVHLIIANNHHFRTVKERTAHHYIIVAIDSSK